MQAAPRPAVIEEEFEMHSLFSKSLSVLFATATCFLYFAQSSEANGNRVEYHDHMTYGRISGWERDLTYRDPNLSHWHWEPIGVSAHVRTRTVSGEAIPTVQKVQHYVKSVYVKPIHVAMPNSQQVNGGRNSSADINGKLLSPSKNRNNLLAQSPAVATYSTYSSNSTTSSAAARSAVAGKLLRSNKF